MDVWAFVIGLSQISSFFSNRQNDKLEYCIHVDLPDAVSFSIHEFVLVLPFDKVLAVSTQYLHRMWCAAYSSKHLVRTDLGM